MTFPRGGTKSTARAAAQHHRTVPHPWRERAARSQPALPGRPRQWVGRPGCANRNRVAALSPRRHRKRCRHPPDSSATPRRARPLVPPRLVAKQPRLPCRARACSSWTLERHSLADSATSQPARGMWPTQPPQQAKATATLSRIDVGGYPKTRRIYGRMDRCSRRTAQSRQLLGITCLATNEALGILKAPPSLSRFASARVRRTVLAADLREASAWALEKVVAGRIVGLTRTCSLATLSTARRICVQLAGTSAIPRERIPAGSPVKRHKWQSTTTCRPHSPGCTAAVGTSQAQALPRRQQRTGTRQRWSSESNGRVLP